MWERRISHEGLNAYRVVRGSTEEDVTLKAQCLLAAWEDRWQRVLQRQRTRQNRSWAVALAQQQTNQSRIELERLSTILSRALQRGDFDWESRKDHSVFAEMQPKKPVEEELPAPPLKGSFLHPLSLVEILLPPLKKRAQRANEARFQAAYGFWQNYVAPIQQANDQLEKEFQHATDEWRGKKLAFAQSQVEQHALVERQRSDYLAGKPDAMLSYWHEVLAETDYPPEWPREASANYLEKTKMLVVDYELPHIDAIPNLKEVKYIAVRAEFKEIFISDAQLKRTYDDVLYQVALGAIYRLFLTDKVEALASIIFNGWVQSIDKATGIEIHPCIMSVQASKEEFLSLNLSQVDLHLCFKKLKGVSGSKLTDLSPVKPILVLNKEDSRFVPAYNVADALDDRTNLAAMDWLDFENLIREIFEKVFSKNGGEVKITQASRDGGVDAIAFDPDPIRGGKIVIQAKRYTNAVGVSAVRDLYGTVHNEGAIKGILVTTSDFGPDAYEFVKGKPLTLLSGSELLYLLQEHGYQAKIDIVAAKQAFAADAARLGRTALKSVM